MQNPYKSQKKQYLGKRHIQKTKNFKLQIEQDTQLKDQTSEQPESTEKLALDAKVPKIEKLSPEIDCQTNRRKSDDKTGPSSVEKSESKIHQSSKKIKVKQNQKIQKAISKKEMTPKKQHEIRVKILHKNNQINQESLRQNNIPDKTQITDLRKSQQSQGNLKEPNRIIVRIDDSESDIPDQIDQNSQSENAQLQSKITLKQAKPIKKKSSLRIPNFEYISKLRRSSNSVVDLFNTNINQVKSNNPQIIENTQQNCFDTGSLKFDGITKQKSNSQAISEYKDQYRIRNLGKSQVSTNKAIKDSYSLDRQTKSLKYARFNINNTASSLKQVGQQNQNSDKIQIKRRFSSPVVSKRQSALATIQNVQDKYGVTSCCAQPSSIQPVHSVTVSRINEEDLQQQDEQFNSEICLGTEPKINDQVLSKRVQKQIDKINLQLQRCSSTKGDQINTQDVAGYGMRRRNGQDSYTLDKMRSQDFYNRIIWKNYEQEDEINLQRAINMSLEHGVKEQYKRDNPQSKKYERKPKTLGCEQTPEDNQINSKNKQFQDYHQNVNQQEFEIPSISQQNDNNNSQDSEFLPNNDMINSKVKNQNCQISEQIGAKSGIKSFQKPIPVNKKVKQSNQSQGNTNSYDQTQINSNRDQIQSKQYQPNIKNAMDLSIRDEFTDMIKFVDFSKSNTENALYGPAIIQQIQQKQQDSSQKTNDILMLQSPQKNRQQVTESDKLSQTTATTNVQLISTNISTQNSDSILQQIAPSIHSSQTPQHTLSLSQQSARISFKDVSKNHFIRKKQTQCNIKRVCGVSYVKKTESKQENVRDRYDKLPPIVIQGSYTLPKNKNRFFDDDLMQRQVLNILDKVFFNGSNNIVLLVTTFESSNEILMKNYLLKPHKRPKLCGGRYWLLTRQENQQSILDQLWRFIKDKHFLVLHLKYCQVDLIKSFEFHKCQNSQDIISIEEQVKNFVVESDICLGILPKRGNASIRSMLKVYKLESIYDSHLRGTSNAESNIELQKLLKSHGAQLQGINTIGYLSRLELYVSEQKWRNSSFRQQCALNALIDLLEDQISTVLQQWNYNRSQIYQEYLKNDQLNVQSSSMFLNRNNIICVKLDNTKINQAVQMKEQLSKVKPWPDLAANYGLLEDDPITQQIQSNQLKSPINLQDFKLENLSGIDCEADPLDIFSHLKKGAPIPITLINTRDCFAYDLKYVETKIDMGKNRPVAIKKEYYFDPSIENGYPENFKQVLNLKNSVDMTDIENLKIGVTCYENFFSHKELQEIEKNVEITEEKSIKDTYLPMTAQMTYTGQALKRTKFFFGYRYMWTRTQLQDPLSNVAAGVRADVSQPPVWFKSLVEEPMVNKNIVDKGFINSVALNVYHDGSEGLAQHFDDATRFKQPIYTLRLFSDSRLSFGSQYYGFQNSAYTIPLPRGCICVMEEGSYSANGVKHCIRPCDMTGKSSAVILRQMHPNVVEEAKKLDRNIDLPMWFSTLTLENQTNDVDKHQINSSNTDKQLVLPFYRQKELECEWLEKQVNNLGCQAKSKLSNNNAKSAKSPILNNKESKLNIIGKKRPLGQGFSLYSSPLSVDPNQYNSQFKYDSQCKREIGQLMHDIIYRIEQKAHQEEEIIQRIQRMRNEKINCQKRQNIQNSQANTNGEPPFSQSTQAKSIELEAVQLFDIIKVKNCSSNINVPENDHLECDEKVQLVDKQNSKILETSKN